ncbi:hypothetical protein CONLIGDRAFT_639915 [Coniochaeta ligniaria NRRL 30616]|uniref:Uncharacterized protein n=1 Tax=Coniochaeta ligniaria NRRL 30616 TaxID=1408157 RepID=A0A1J7JQH6_9PEZI|nr:hypothetical protein CONLIGDRAFT_639915 [Coniochaeta ligniaria NRRL 30616]
MSSGTGPPAPPPLRKSRWSWWKPVKGTSANDNYYYNANSNSNSRPGSSSSTRPGTSTSTNKLTKRRGRSSLSVLDDKRAETLRKEVSDYMKDGPPAMTSSSTNVVTIPANSNTSNDKSNSSNPPSGSGVSKNNRKSTSR